MDSSSILLNLILNLITEGIGIIVAVFIIDRWLKRREERRWKPSKGALKARIFSAIQSIIGEATPSEFLQVTGVKYLRFGNSSANESFQIREPFPLPRPLIEGVSQRLEIATDGVFSINKLFLAKQQIDDIVNTAGFMLEPELLELLLELDRRFLLLKQPEGEDGDALRDNKKRELSATFIAVIIESAYEAHNLLIKQADKHYTDVNEYVNDIIPPDVRKTKRRTILRFLPWLNKLIAK